MCITEVEINEKSDDVDEHRVRRAYSLIQP